MLRSLSRSSVRRSVGARWLATLRTAPLESSAGCTLRATGLCACFPGYGSSDGQGGPGPYEDCGFPMPAVEELSALAGNTQ